MEGNIIVIDESMIGKVVLGKILHEPKLPMIPTMITVEDIGPAPKLSIIDSDDFIIRNYDKLHQIPERLPNPKKPHKHEYKQKDGAWICNCGRKL